MVCVLPLECRCAKVAVTLQVRCTASVARLSSWTVLPHDAGDLFAYVLLPLLLQGVHLPAYIVRIVQEPLWLDITNRRCHSGSLSLYAMHTNTL